MLTLSPQAKSEDGGPSVEAPSRAPKELQEIRLPSLDQSKTCGAFTSLDAVAKPFFPEIKVHTGLGLQLRDLSQADIPFASKEYRLRSEHLAQTLRLFGHKASKCLPEGFCVQVDLSPFGGSAACDTVTLIHHPRDGDAQAILEQHYLPFNGGGIGWMVPTDEAKNTVLKLEERLFYYKTLLAIKTAIENRLSRLSAPA